MFAPFGWLKRPIYREIYHTIESSPFFDKSWYRGNNRGFLGGLSDPVWHYITKGWHRGCDPSPLFDTSYYVEAYPDVRESGINPLYHFVKYGKQEQRSTLRSGKSIAAYYLSSTSPVRTVLVDGEKKTRTTLLVDQNTPEVLTDALSRGASGFLQPKTSLRIIVNEPAGSTLVSERIHTQLAAKNVVANISRITGEENYSDVPRFADERFMATSWSSCMALLHLSMSTVVDCAFTTKNSGIELVPVTKDFCDKSMVDALVGSDLPALGAPPADRTDWTVPPAGLIGAYCDAENSPLGFFRTIQLIESSLLQHPTDHALPELYVFGGSLEPFALWGSVVPRFISTKGAKKLASQSSVIIALSEHPLSDEIHDVLSETRGVIVSHQLVESGSFSPVDVRKFCSHKPFEWKAQA